MARSTGIQLNTGTMDILLYLCSGGRSWDSQLAGASAAGSGAAAAGNGTSAKVRGGTEAGAGAESSNGSSAPASSIKVEDAHASASPQDPKTPAEAGAGSGRAGSTGRDGTQQPDAAASLSEEVRLGALQSFSYKLWPSYLRPSMFA